MRSGLLLATMALSLGTASPVPFTDLATPFERIAITTAGWPDAERIAAVRRGLDGLLPGIYPPGAAIDRRIAKALAEFPADRAGYEAVVQTFPEALAKAVTRFRRVFPRFMPPLPLYLYHSLGMRDGGSAYLAPGHRLVMLFGADRIASLHRDDSLEPFLEHELFHLEHARTFPDCDPLWCVLWQEGLAVDAAATMTPGATDRQLLLDTPIPMRAPTDRRWPQALCFVADHFDDTNGVALAQAIQIGGTPSADLPSRFGYYVGLRVAKATGRPITQLAQLGHADARKLLRVTLARLMREASAPCTAPKE